MRQRCLLTSIALIGMLGVGCSRSAPYYLARGDQAFRAGHYPEATLEYRKAIQKDPNSGQPYYRLYESLLEQRQWLGAYQALSQAVKAMPANQEAKAKLADLNLAAYIADPKKPRALYDQAAQLAQQLAALNPNSAEAIRLQGSIALLDQKPQQAIAFFRQAAVIAPTDSRILLGLAQGLYQDNQPAEGERLVHQLLASQNHTPAYDFLIGHYLDANRWQDAETLLKDKVAKNQNDALAILELAAHELRMKKPDGAASALQRFLDNPKTFPDARLRIGDFYANSASWPEALRQYEEGARGDSQRRPVYQKRRITALAALGRSDEALAALELILKQQPSDDEAIQARASLWLEGDGAHLQPAIRDLSALAGKRPNDLDLRLRLGQAYLRRDDLASARKEFEAILQKNAASIPARLELAQLAVAQARHQDVLRLTDEVLAVEPNHPQARLLRSVALTGSSRFAEANAELTRLTREYPAYTDARVALGSLAIAEGKFDQAQQIFSSLRPADQSDARPAAGLAQTLVARNQYDKAMALLDVELKKPAVRPAVRSLQAEIALRAQKYDVAIAQYQTLFTAAPQSAELAMHLGDAYQRSGDLPNAILMFGKAAELNPKAPAIAMFLAGALERGGRSQDAAAAYRRALVLQPDNVMVLNNLALLLSATETGRDEAVRLAQKALQQTPDQPEIMDTLGSIYLKTRSTGSASQIFAGLVRKYPSNPTFHYHLGLAMLQKGDPSSARSEFGNALANRPRPEEAREIKNLVATLPQ